MRHSRSDNPTDFGQFLEVFERYTRDQTPLTHPEEQFVILRSAEFRSIEELAGGNYDVLEKAEIEGFLEQVRLSTEMKRQRVIGATEKWENSVTSP